MRCSGLLMINGDDEAILLHASRSYPSKRIENVHYYADDDDHHHHHHHQHEKNFLEKISIPRGKRDSRDIFDYETAIREFIEETGTVFDGAYVYRKPFLLHWTDNSVGYTYMIYVALLHGTLRTLARKPNTFCVNLLRRKHNRYVVEFEERRHYNREIPRALHIVPTSAYFRYMREQQLVKYESSNYLDFFTFVEAVKTAFKEESGRGDERFFYLQLQLHNRSPWNRHRRPAIVTTTTTTTSTNTTTRNV